MTTYMWYQVSDRQATTIDYGHYDVISSGYDEDFGPWFRYTPVEAGPELPPIELPF